ncbi:MAG: NTP transferase domain-containing protein [Proteobacteria bacterium]|nr:NTP transferase domain-containing protein [Pseudomonadota bacterium]
MLKHVNDYTDAGLPDQAIILAAGLGSRLAKTADDIKPLKMVGGLSLIQRNIELLSQTGIKEVIIVTGYHADVLEAALRRDCAHVDVTLRFRFNPDYRKSNGLSVLCAQPLIRGNFLLMMADHIFEPAMLAQAATIRPPGHGAVLCVDYKLDSIFDMDDATKVVVDDGRISAIGKGLSTYNAIDTGLFVCTPALFTALQEAANRSPASDCSLSEGIATLMQGGRMMSHDIGDQQWQDVDDEMMLQQAERFVGAHPSPRTVAISA